jgi:hypothetical protein
MPTGNTSPQEAFAAERIVGTVSRWERSADLRPLILHHAFLPKPRRQTLVPVGEFVGGTLQERAVCRLAHHHYRIGAIDGDERDDAPRYADRVDRDSSALQSAPERPWCGERSSAHVQHGLTVTVGIGRPPVWAHTDPSPEGMLPANRSKEEEPRDEAQHRQSRHRFTPGHLHKVTLHPADASSPLQAGQSMRVALVAALRQPSPRWSMPVASCWCRGADTASGFRRGICPFHHPICRHHAATPAETPLYHGGVGVSELGLVRVAPRLVCAQGKQSSCPYVWGLPRPGNDW